MRTILFAVMGGLSFTALTLDVQAETRLRLERPLRCLNKQGQTVVSIDPATREAQYLGRPVPYVRLRQARLTTGLTRIQVLRDADWVGEGWRHCAEYPMDQFRRLAVEGGDCGPWRWSRGTAHVYIDLAHPEGAYLRQRTWWVDTSGPGAARIFGRPGERETRTELHCEY